jgi:gliding motility-associated-like protein
MIAYKKYITIVSLMACMNTQQAKAQESEIKLGTLSVINNDWQSGGIFYGKTPQQEIISARTANTKKFDRGNGLVDIYFGGPFHYMDQAGAWQDINLDIRSQANTPFKYINQDNRFISRFSENAVNGVQMEYKQQPIAFGIGTKVFSGNWSPISVPSQSAIVKENKIEYPNIYKDVSIAYEVSTRGIAHKMIFDNRGFFSGIQTGQENVTIEETIQLPTDAKLVYGKGEVSDGQTSTGNIFIVVSGDTIYTIMAAHIWDASFTGSIDEQSQSPEIIDAFKQVPLTINFLSGNKIKLGAQIPTSWLLSPNRIFPITFDPTVSVGNVGSFASSYRYPFNTCRQQRVSQILFRKSDINAGGINTTGTITAIEFLQSTPVPMQNNNVQVRMQEVAWNDMTTAVLTTAGFTPVHGPSTQTFMSGSNTWRTLSLNSPFPFTNTANLLVEVSFRNSNSTPGCTCTQTGPGGYWGYFDAPYHGHRWAYSMSAAPPPSGGNCEYTNSPENNPAYGSLIPATKITINTTAGCAPVTLTSNPSSQSVVAPAQVQFSVTVSGTTPTYQWELSTNGGATWGNVPSGTPYSGITTNQLTVNPTSGGMNGYQYRCKVSNSCTTPIAISGAGVLTVNASGCNTVLGPPTSSNLLVGAGGGTFKITVTPNTCNWSISATQPWIIIGGALSGTGSVASKSYTVTANNGGFRTGNIIVNGQIFTVNQAGNAAPTTYIIDGKVIKQDGSPLDGVSVSLINPPALSPVTTNAQGYYSFVVPLTYIGTVKPTLAPYTFTPASRNVNSLANSNIDFQAISARIVITSPTNTFAPWQREGDDFGGTITVALQNTTTQSWHLQADVYNANNVQVGSAPFPSTTSTSFTFNSSQSNQLRNLSLNGRRVEYVAIFDADNSIKDTIGSTNIIEKKWDKKNIVLWNKAGESLKIPLKYTGTTIDRVLLSFRRYSNSDGKTSTSDVILARDTSSFFESQNQTNLRYFDIPVSGNNNLSTISPGVFEYNIEYYNGSTLIESEIKYTLDLTKIGKITYPNPNGFGVNSNRVIILVGGIKNETEAVAQAINGYNSSGNNNIDPSYLGSKISMSIISFFNSYGFDTWYIGQPNLNGVRENAYDIGQAIKRIKEITNTSDISIICHSKGGLDVKGMLGATMNNNLSRALDGNQFDYSQSTINNIVKKVVFLASPHRGAKLAYLTQYSPNNSGCPASTGCYDLIWDEYTNSNSVINSINRTPMPIGTSFLNLTSFGPSYTTNWIGLLSDGDSDGVVGTESSEGLKLNNGDSFIQLYQNYSNHFNVHQNYFLSTNGKCTNANNKNIAYIYYFINNQFSQTCHRNLLGFYSLQAIKSVLSGATIRYKVANDSTFQTIGATDENGKLNFWLFNPLASGDSIEMSATGVDTLKFSPQFYYNDIHKMQVALFPLGTPTNKIAYPSLSIIGQSPIVGQPNVNLLINARNATTFFKNVQNADTIFSSVTPVNNVLSILLDTGYNKVLVKCINPGIDTVTLIKELYYLPGPLMNLFAKDISVNIPPSLSGSKIFFNNAFYQVLFTNTTLKILKESGKIKISKFGYLDTLINVENISSINVIMQPYSYSSLTDSTIFDFSTGLNPQYWKTITVKNISPFKHKQISAKQYDDAFTGMSLIPQSRKFVFRNFAISGISTQLKTAIALDQINTPEQDSVYILSIKDGRYFKHKANQANVSEYDTTVQKLAFDLINIGSGQVQEIVLMRKQAPIMNSLDSVWHSGQTIAFPFKVFVTDPDSIKNDIVINSLDAKVSVIGNIVYVTAPINFTGTLTFTISGTHDFITKSKTYIMKVIPPEVYIPTGFTPNGDGVNDIIRPSFLGKIISCHLIIYNRNGQKVFDTQDCISGWDGKIKGQTQDSGGYVYHLTYQFAGESEKQTKGSFVLLK